jgi:hypothetical protein
MCSSLALLAHVAQIVLSFCPKHNEQAPEEAQRPGGQVLRNGLTGNWEYEKSYLTRWLLHGAYPGAVTTDSSPRVTNRSLHKLGPQILAVFGISVDRIWRGVQEHSFNSLVRLDRGQVCVHFIGRSIVKECKRNSFVPVGLHWR